MFASIVQPAADAVDVAVTAPESTHLLGVGAGVITAMCWTATTLFFTAAGKRLGSTAVNAIRIVLAIILLGLTFHFFISDTGAWLPDANSKQISYLALSGIIGLSIGDQALFTAFIDVGPRVSALLMTTAPVFAAFFAWIALDESLTGWALIGIALTIGGVAWTILERPEESGARHPHRVRGIILGVIAAMCQGGGLLLSKIGIGHGWMPREDLMNPQPATLYRMLFAGVGMVPILFLYHRRAKRLKAAGRAPLRIGTRQAGMMFLLCGSIVGPYLGVWLSLVAADNTNVGVAQTLMSLTPIFILPFMVWIHRERVSPRAIFGAMVAVGGVAMLVWQAPG